MTLPSEKYKQYEKYQDVTNGTMRYYEFGSGEPTLLLHGMGVQTSAETFQFMFDELGKSFKIYALDYLGFGKSTRKMEYGPTFDVINDGIRDFMDAKGIAKANIVGHSAGGWFGGLLAYQSPERVNRCVFIGSAGMMRCALAWALNWARHRVAFGRPLIDQPLMTNVLADLALETEAALLLALDLAATFDPGASPQRSALARLLVPAAKYWVCKRAPMVR